MAAIPRSVQTLLGLGLSLVTNAICHVAVQIFFGQWLWTRMIVTSSITKSFFTSGVIFVALAVFPLLIANTVLWLLLRKKYPNVSRGVRWGYVFAIILFFLQMQPIQKADTSIGPIQRTYRSMELGDPANCTRENLQASSEDMTESNIGRCFAAAAVKRLDATLCERISEGTSEWSKGNLQSEKYNCYFDVAVASNDPSLCDRLSGAELCRQIVNIRWQAK